MPFPSVIASDYPNNTRPCGLVLKQGRIESFTRQYICIHANFPLNNTLGPMSFDLAADGSAKDPQAFRSAIRSDAAKMAELEKDPQLAAVLLDGDLAAMQELLRSTYQVSSG